eukprot:NODE_129_length_16972_cov_2.172643.p7 type:complete len:346 gc:universal NODE_129_length_16972_cov_2.172643:10624-9587(-)
MDTFEIFATALETSNGSANQFTEKLLHNLDESLIIYWIFKYYTIHYNKSEPIDGVVDSYIDDKRIEWIQGLNSARFDLSDVDFTSELDPLHDDIQTLYLFGLLSQGKPWNDERIHSTWKVMFEGNAVFQKNANGEWVGNPCRAIHQKVAKKMLYLTSKYNTKRLLCIFANDYHGCMLYIDHFLDAIWVYSYLEREAGRINISKQFPKYFKGSYDKIELPSLEDFLENLKCSKQNNLRREANDPINMIISAVLASSELYQIENLCSKRVLRHEDNLRLDFQDFGDNVILSMIHIIILFHFEGEIGLMQQDWVIDLFQHFLTVLIQYDFVLFTNLVPSCSNVLLICF